MDSNHIESNDTYRLANLLRREIEHAMERSFKLEERKIIFVIGLFGIGGFDYLSIFLSNSLNNRLQLQHLFFLAPFVAILFDILISKQKYSIRRIGAFLEKHSYDGLERRWEKFVSDNREKELFNYSHIGFTVLTIVASFLVIKSIQFNEIKCIELIIIFWFTIIVIIYVYVLLSHKFMISNLDKT